MPASSFRSVRAVAAGVLVTAAISVGCNGIDTGVTAPTVASNASPVSAPSPGPPAATLGVLWGMVIQSSGACIENATVQVVSGQRQGESHVQLTPCDAWAYDGGFVFTDLTPGVPLTVRASAPGWTTQEKTFTPFTGSYMAVYLTLSPAS